MTKTHAINLVIANDTSEDLTFADDWFQTGGLADGNSWPTTIPAGTVAAVQCCESFWSPVGCSGWVKYTFNYAGTPGVFFAFSNPLVGGNGIDLGSDTSIWNNMTAHYDYPVSRPVNVEPNSWLIADVESTSGQVNTAHFNLQQIHTMNDIVPANIELTDAQATFAAIPSTPSYRKYYKCDDDPTSLTGMAQSHFKGISAYGEKLIFSHTNIDIMPTLNGKVIVADLLPGAGQAETDLTSDTSHPGWLHPCSSQACGSYMALGIQASAKGSGADRSEIEILDARAALINYPPELIGVIERPSEGVNGVAMTKETGPDGKYIVAAVNGGSLTFYKSQSATLLSPAGQPTVAFDTVFHTDAFEESGAGLGLVTQQDGRIFLVTMNADDDGSNSTACLYEFLNGDSPSLSSRLDKHDLPVTDMSASITTLEKEIAAIALWSPAFGAALYFLLQHYGAPVLNSSFRWGKGLAITANNAIELYASDRNVLPLSRIPIFTCDQDFSVLVWATDAKASA